MPRPVKNIRIQLANIRIRTVAEVVIGVFYPLGAGGVFSIVGGLTGSPGETAFYFVLAAVHFWLATVH